jgi:uncharacterized membrane protein
MHTYLLYLHILGGTISLILGIVPIISKKGGNLHKFTGRIFGIAMLVATLSGVVLSVIRPQQMLFLVGLFSSYLVIAGVLPLRLMGPQQLNTIKKALILPTLGLMLAVAMLLYAGYHLIQGNAEGIVIGVFGLGLLTSAMADYKWISRLTETTRTQLISIHVGRIVGAYIASCTAFLVVNQPIPVPIANWFIANLVFVPVIVYWQRKLAKPKQAVTVS